jgi:ribosomal protein S11
MPGRKFNVDAGVYFTEVGYKNSPVTFTDVSGNMLGTTNGKTIFKGLN